MKEDLKIKILDLLKRNEELPREWLHELFPPDKQEYELVYFDKEREEDIISNTMSLPLQPVSNFGKKIEDWHNMLIFGDNLQAMKTLLEKKNSGTLCNADGSVGVRLIYIDPPFATKKDFSGSQDQKAYTDKIAGAEFIEFLRKRLVLLKELLSDDGSLFIHLDTKKSHYIKAILDEVFGEENFQNEVIWKRSSAHSDSDTFANLHDTIFFYSKSSEFVFNQEYQPYSEDYIEERYKHIEKNRRYLDRDLSAKGLKGGGYLYKWKGIYQSWRCPITTIKRYEKENRLYYTKNGVARYKQYLDEMPGVALQDIWLDINAVNSQALERVDYPTQKPESLLNRIIKAGSNPGDIVLDAFAGSGTTSAVSEKLQRRWIALDCGKLSIYTIQKRMLNLRAQIGNKGNPINPKPFTLYNAGLYDFSSLRKLPWLDWRFFALQLFGCKDDPHSIGGLDLDGKLKGASVLVFNHIEHVGKRIDDGTIQDIHLAVGKKIGRKFFIIAPKGVFDFQQDYIDIENVRYYALRIPYSVINELHYRDFAALQQPNDESAVNDTVDAVGFDFIQPPQIQWSISTKKRKGELFTEGCLKIKQFESRARIRGKDTRGGLETLSMVMFDFNFDGKVFDLDAAYYRNHLESDDWQAWFPIEKVGDNIMAVFIDIYGNEAREIIPNTKLGLETKKQKSKSKKSPVSNKHVKKHGQTALQK